MGSSRVRSTSPGLEGPKGCSVLYAYHGTVCQLLRSVTTGAGVESVNGCKKTGLIQANSRLVGAPLQRGVPVMKTWPYSAFSCCSAPSLAAHAPPSRS